MIKFDAPYWDSVTFDNKEDVYNYFLNCDLSQHQLLRCGIEFVPSKDIEYEWQDTVECEDLVTSTVCPLNHEAYVVPINDLNPYYYNEIGEIQGAQLSSHSLELTREEINLDESVWNDYPVTVVMAFYEDSFTDDVTEIFYKVKQRTVDCILGELDDCKDEEIEKLKQMLECERKLKNAKQN